MVHFLADDKDLPDQRNSQKLMRGLVNNLPHLANMRELSANEKRRAVRELQLERPPGPLSEMPLLKIDGEWHKHIDRYLCKLAKALFYKHVGAPAGRDFVGWSEWTYEKIGLNRGAIEQWIQMTPIVEIGRRANVDLGDRFHYRVNHSAELGAFAAVGKFGRGLIFYALVLEPSLSDRLGASALSRLKGQRS